MNETKQELQERLKKAEAEIAIVREQLAKAEEPKPLDDGMFVPRDGDSYQYVDSHGDIHEYHWYGEKSDQYRHSIGNCFTNDDDGTRAAELYKIKLSWLGLNAGKPMPGKAWCVDTLGSVYETRVDCHPYTWLAWETGRYHPTRNGAVAQLEQIQARMQELGL